jgi:hypothetical protein
MPNPKKPRILLLLGIFVLLFAFAFIPLLGRISKMAHAADSNSAVPPNGWQFFSSEEQSFRVLFPGTPKQTNFTQSVADNAALCHFYYAADANRATYAVVCGDYDKPEALHKLSLEQRFDMSAKATEAKYGKIVSQRDFSFQNYPAREFELVATGKNHFSVKMRLVWADDRLYNAMVIFPTTNPHSDDLKTFFDSFAITKKREKMMKQSRSFVCVLDCGGRAQRRHRFGRSEDSRVENNLRAVESGVALRFPPQSKTRWVSVRRRNFYFFNSCFTCKSAMSCLSLPRCL